jgi:hypothetical protein
VPRRRGSLLNPEIWAHCGDCGTDFVPAKPQIVGLLPP